MMKLSVMEPWQEVIKDRILECNDPFELEKIKVEILFEKMLTLESINEALYGDSKESIATILENIENKLD